MKMNLLKKKAIICKTHYKKPTIFFFAYTGMRSFRLRIHRLLHSMFKLEPIHLAATLLRPQYRLLKKCFLDEVRECYRYIRQRIAQIKSMKTCKSTFDISEKHSSMANNVTLNEPVKKKLKRFGRRF